MTFSRRTAWDLAENDLTVAVRAHRAAGRALLDLTVSNPTVCGFEYDAAELLAPLADPAALVYDPDPLGKLSAREAVSRYYEDLGADVRPGRLCLTTSTSEAYSFLFRLLCDPGDEVLVARPSYPLFEFIARLDDVQLREYPLFYDEHSWSIDLHALEESINPRTRAVVLVHPNNPTGHFTSQAEREALERLCAAHDLALIVDEVFLDYALEPPAAPSFTTGEPACLTFVLSGISKLCALPQMKASWLAACGPGERVRAAMARMEVIADTFLSMNAPIQHALPGWLGARQGIQSQIRTRMVANLQMLDDRLAGTAVRRLALQAGWTVILQVPRLGADLALAALEQGVLVQPGSFYGLPEGRIVLSLLTLPEVWQQGIARLCELFHG